MNPEDAYEQDDYQNQLDAMYKYKAMGMKQQDIAKMIDMYKNQMERTKERTFCRKCGSDSTGGMVRNSFAHAFGVCATCMDKVMHDFWKNVVNESMPKDDPNYCYDCYSHLNACKCPKSEAMRKIKR